MALVLLTLGVATIAFCLTQVVPGDPIYANLGDVGAADPQAVAAFREKYGLDKPLPTQYRLYLERLVQGDLGQSQQSRRPVMEDLRAYVPATIEVTLFSVLIAFPLGISMGVVAALRRNGIVDQILRVISLFGMSFPVFWLALLAIFIFYYKLNLLPAFGRLDPGEAPPRNITGFYTVDALVTGDFDTFRSAVRHAVLPAVVLAGYSIAILMRFTRSAVLDVVHLDYIRAGHAKGLSNAYVTFRHVLRAALPPIITVGGLLFAHAMVGSVLIETIFAWPGMGAYAYRSATNLDLPAIMGVSIFVAIVYVTLNFAADVLYGIVDPRIRLS